MLYKPYKRNTRIRIQGGTYHGQTGKVSAQDAIDRDYTLVKLDGFKWDIAIPTRRLLPE